MAWFRRKNDDESMDPQVLLATANAESPPAAVFVSGSFRMPVQDVFTITGRGTVVTGRVESGSVSKDQVVRLTRGDGSSREITIVGVEMFRKVVDTASAGDTVGLLLKSVPRQDIAVGDVLSA